MTDFLIDNITTSAGALTGAERFEIAQGTSPANSSKVLLSVLAAYIGGGAVSPPRTAVTSPVTLTTADLNRTVYTNLTVAGAVSVVLPAAASLGDRYRTVDAKGDAGTNKVTTTAADGALLVGSSSYVTGLNFEGETWEWNGAQWSIIA